MIWRLLYALYKDVTGATMLSRFIKDKWFLLKYYVLNILLLSIAIHLLFQVSSITQISNGWLWFAALIPIVMGGLITIAVTFLVYLILTISSDWYTFSIWHLLLIPVGIILGLYSSVLMHASVHKQFKPRFLNRWIGELLSIQQLIGYYGWSIPHVIHHAHPDDPKLDPHPPGNHGFLAYSQRMKATIVGCLENNYFKAFGDSNSTHRIWVATKITLVVNRTLRAVFVMLLLGPIVFTFLFLPSFLSQMLFYVHFNWASHRAVEGNYFGVYNLDKGLYYKTMNAMLFGMYYHKNHHLNPSLFDPRELGDTGDEPLISHST